MKKIIVLSCYLAACLWMGMQWIYPVWKAKGSLQGLGSALLSVAMAGLLLLLNEILQAYYALRRQFQFLFEQSPIPMGISDVATSHFQAVNKAAETQYGYTEAEFKTMKVQDVWQQDPREPLLKPVRHMPRVGVSHLGIFLHKRKMLPPFFASIFSSSASYKGRKAALTVAVNVHDPIRQKEAAPTQPDSSNYAQVQYLASIMERQFKFFILRFTLNGIYTYTNPALCRRLGLDASKVIGTSVFDSFLPDDATVAGDAIMQSITHIGKSFPIRLRSQMPDNTIVIVDYKMAAITGPDGNVSEIQCVGVEVTDQVKHLEDLTRYKNQLELILSSITDGFYMLDKDSCLTYINEPMATAIGQTQEALLGQNLYSLLPPDQVDFHRAHFQAVLAGQKSVHFETYFEMYQMWISEFVYPATDGLVVFWKDITEFKTTQAHSLKQDLRLKQIAWVQSHQVRGPLARIMGLIKILNLAHPDDPFNLDVIDMLKESSQQLDSVIHEVVVNTHLD